ncbi:MAG TPA: signal peptide peptidase SppA, partial [Chitinophagaceae bacterium]|nr:signal peptide peptidase SppA [Chitinophagaceae bacterium]
MKGFFKIFFASLLSLVVFSGLCMLLLFFILLFATLRAPVSIPDGSVLVVDLTKPLPEQDQTNPLNAVLHNGPSDIPGLFSTATVIRESATDRRIRGIYLRLGADPNGLASGEEIRDALLYFRSSGKFILAYGDDITQKSYYIASAATKIYLNPKGELDFRGFAVEEMFLKHLLDKLEIHPQIFYDGKFKSATEPLRVDKMTDANRLQTSAMLGDEYRHFLLGISEERHIDTATLAGYADSLRVRTAGDAYRLGLVDGLRYDDQVSGALRRDAGYAPGQSAPLVSTSVYKQAGSSVKGGTEQVAIVYAEGDIVDGKAQDNGLEIAADDYVSLLRRLRRDPQVRAIVFRVNSPGGSALAAEKIWRELSLTEKSIPVVVSMGDYAASGGYYISCGADRIFAEPSTLTGSIGVFGIIPDLSSFFNDKLGITFDGVKTAPFADMESIAKPLTAQEKQIIQESIDTTYAVFKERVATGRKLEPSFVDSIAQGRVWTGHEALQIGLVDSLGNLEAAIREAAKLAHLGTYSLQSYPQVRFDLRSALINLEG